MNSNFWPPFPKQEIRFPHITLITKIASKRAFQPFHYGNMFLIRTIAWLVSINFILLDDLTQDDRNELNEYHSSLQSQVNWSLDDDDEEFIPTAAQKTAWLQKYKRRAAFLQRKKQVVVHEQDEVAAFLKKANPRLIDEGVPIGVGLVRSH